MDGDKILHGKSIDDWRRIACAMTHRILRKWGCLKQYYKEELQDLADMGLVVAFHKFDPGKAEIELFIYFQLLEGCRGYVKERVRQSLQDPLLDYDEVYCNIDLFETKSEFQLYMDRLNENEKKVIEFSFRDYSLAEMASRLGCCVGNVMRIRRIVFRKYKGFKYEQQPRWKDRGRIRI